MRLDPARSQLHGVDSCLFRSDPGSDVAEPVDPGGRKLLGVDWQEARLANACHHDRQSHPRVHRLVRRVGAGRAPARGRLPALELAAFLARGDAWDLPAARSGSSTPSWCRSTARGTSSPSRRCCCSFPCSAGSSRCRTRPRPTGCSCCSPSSQDSAAATSPPSCHRPASSSPSDLQGTALAIQAGIGNFGVSIVQFVTPWIIGIALAGSLLGGSQTFTSDGIDEPGLAAKRRGDLRAVHPCTRHCRLGDAQKRAGARQFPRAARHLQGEARLLHDASLHRHLRHVLGVGGDLPAVDQADLWRAARRARSAHLCLSRAAGRLGRADPRGPDLRQMSAARALRTGLASACWPASSR